MKTPVLFIIFNRPETTQKVFNAIRKAQPKMLFIAADGPRVGREDDKKKCEEARDIIKQVDWDCEVKTLYQDNNLGCGYGPSTAITWFFDNVEEGIILEDDCLPDLSFFSYCEEILSKYRNDDKVYMISGSNYLPKSLKLKESYYFSNLPHIGGWATWRRAWINYSFGLNGYNEFKKENKIKQIWSDKNIQEYFLERLDEIINGKTDAWDYQWTYTIWNKNGFSVAPSVNLISNIGFGADGTHTFNENDISANLPLEEMKFPLVDYNAGIYNLGDDYEKKLILGKYYELKKILKKIGLFKIIKNIYLLLK